MKPVRDKINISQVCRDALERQVSLFERASGMEAAEADLETTVSRLREERENAEGKFEDLGKRNAAVWLSTAAYLDLKSVANNDRVFDIGRYRLPRAAFQIMKQDMKESEAGLDGVPALAYKSAWLDHAGAVAAQVAHPQEQANGAEPVEASA